MANSTSEYPDFESVKTRLDQIVEAVSADDIPFDQALDLYEEAVALGMRASDLLEEGLDFEAPDKPKETAEDAAVAVDAGAEIADEASETTDGDAGGSFE